MMQRETNLIPPRVVPKPEEKREAFRLSRFGEHPDPMLTDGDLPTFLDEQRQQNLAEDDSRELLRQQALYHLQLQQHQLLKPSSSFWGVSSDISSQFNPSAYSGLMKKKASAGLEDSEVPASKKARMSCWTCKICQKAIKQQRMREHVAMHMVTANDMEVRGDTCGFCGRAGTCSVINTAGSAKGIQVAFSECEYYYKFNMKSAMKEKSPCSNIPILCPACDEVTFVWKFSMQAHLLEKHPKERFTREFLESIVVTEQEAERLVRKASTTRSSIGGDSD